MDENIFRSVTAGDETEAAHPVEPFDDANLITAGWHHMHMRARLHLRGCTAVDSSIDTTRSTCNPLARVAASQTMRVPS